MIFNSLSFLLFLPLVVILYWLLPRTARVWMLTIMSLVFYGFWKPEYTLLLIFAAVLDYFVALEIARRDDPRKRKNFLIISLVLNLGIGLCTPPVDVVLFVGCAVGRISIWQAMRTIWPFYFAAFVTLMLVTYIPALSLWLPSVFK